MGKKPSKIRKAPRQPKARAGLRDGAGVPLTVIYDRALTNGRILSEVLLRLPSPGEFEVGDELGPLCRHVRPQ